MPTYRVQVTALESIEARLQSPLAVASSVVNVMVKRGARAMLPNVVLLKWDMRHLDGE